MSETRELIKVDDSNREKIFTDAYNGSYYTIIGCGEELEEYIEGYREMLGESKIGAPAKWITFTGREMNLFYGLTDNNAYRDNLVFLMFPLDRLHIGKLAAFKIMMGDRWFDDIVDNVASS